MNVGWSDLAECLDKLDSAHPPVRFWLRDDDGVSDSVPLRRLACWARGNDTEVLLAVIPAMADSSLAEAMLDLPQLVACIHGWAHKNHAPPEQKKQELGAHRPVDDVCEEIAAACEKLSALSLTNSLPVLVPPWNRIFDDLLSRLPGLGIRGLSVFTDASLDQAPRSLIVQNSHLDIIDWRGDRGGQGHSALIKELIGHINQYAPLGQPIGILSHHLVRDEAAWSFLEKLGGLVSAHSRAQWARPREIFRI